jgi:hypothetical protein
MRIIKSFKIFESSLPFRDFESMELRIKQLLDTHYYPNVSFEKEGKKIVKDYLVFLDPTESKYGKQIKVMLRFADLWAREDEWGEEIVTGGSFIKYSQLNPDFKQATIIEDLKDTILEFMTGKIDFIGFEFFGKSAKGQKNGHTKTIEDVTDKFNKALDELEEEDDEVKDGTIFFTFNIS